MPQSIRRRGTEFISRLFERIGLGKKRTRNRNDRGNQQAIEHLEDRALLTLVGVDFGGGILPANWTGFSGTADATLTDLMDETGAATTVDVDINFDATLQGGNTNFSPSALELPIHTTSLAGLDQAVTDQGNLDLTFSDLVPNQFYEIYVFAGDVFSDNQQVTISAPDTGTIQEQFNQPHNADQLIVNDQVGDSASTLTSFAKYAMADTNGDLLITIDSSPSIGGLFGVSGVALRPGTPPMSDLSITATDAVKDEGDAGTTAFTFTVTRTGDLTNPASADYSVTGSGATPADAADFSGTFPTGTVNFAANEGSQIITVDVSGDTVAETDDGFTVTLTNPSPGTTITTNFADGTITNDDPSIFSVAATDATHVEGDAGATTFTYTVTRTGDLSLAATVDFAFAGGVTNPANAADIVGGVFPSGTLNFAANETSQDITIDVNGDLEIEANEVVTVTLSNASAPATIGIASADGVINNDDSTTLDIAPTDATHVEGNAGFVAFTFTVTRNGDLTAATSVDYAITGSGANAADAADFGGALPSGTVNFVAGEASQVITVNVTGDTVIETSEEFTVTLSNPSVPATIVTAAADGLIIDDDSTSVSIAAFPTLTSRDEGNAGNTLFAVQVTRTGDTSGTTTVDWAVTGSSANPADAADFLGGVLPAGTVTFTAGITTQFAFYTVVGDTVIEASEGYTVTLSNPSAPATITANTVDGVIINDDSVLSIAATNAILDEGDAGTTPFTFTVTRTGDMSEVGTVDYAVTGSGANAANAADFGGTLPSGFVSFAAGEETQVVTVDVSGDVLTEGDEGFTVTLGASTLSSTITTGSADGLINNDDITTLSIVATDAVKDEGNIGGTNYEFTVTRVGDLSAASSYDVNVTGAGTDPADAADFGGAFPSLTGNFAAGAATSTVLISVNGDFDIEDDESFTATISSPTNFETISIASANGSIVNDDSTFDVAATNAVLNEGNAGTTSLTFTVMRNGDLADPATVDYAVTGSGADPANLSDFGGTLPGGTLSFAANEMSQVITIDVSGDTVAEADETFTVTLSNATGGASVGTSTADGGILNDDISQLDIVATDAVKAEGASGNTAYTFTVTRSGDVSGAAAVGFAVTGSGTVMADAADFGGVLPTGTVNFAATETTQLITVNVDGDTVIEADEGFTVTLGTPSQFVTLGTLTADGQILNDDSTYSIAATDSVLDEGHAGNTAFTFTVRRTGDVSAAGSIDYAVSGNSADPADLTDFGGVLPSGTVPFAANESTRVITVNVTGDTVAEADEGFRVTLSNANAPATITTPTADGTIINEDFITLDIVGTSAIQDEGDAGNTAFVFTVTRTGDVSGSTTVDYAVTGSGPSPANAADFGGVFPTGTVTFAPNETTQLLTIDVNGDTGVELDDGFTVTLSNPSGFATVTTDTADGQINNDDISLNIAATDAIQDEGATGLTPFTFTVTRGGDLATPTTVDYAVTGSTGTPADAADFGGTLPSGTVNFAIGEDTQVITVNVSGDLTLEGDEGFSVTLSNPSAPAVIGTAVAAGQITNDDASLNIAATDASKAEGDVGNSAFTFTVTRTGDTAEAATVDYAVTGSGTNPADAVDFGGTLPTGVVNFSANQTTQVVTVIVTGDTTVEANDGFTVTLDNPSAPTVIGTGTADGLIINDDVSLAISATDAVKDEGIAGTTSFTFTVTRSGDLTAGTTVEYDVTGIGANPADADDFGGTLPSGVVTFAAGIDTQTITVGVSGDDIAEEDEAFGVTLSNASAPALIGVGAASGVIQNDDTSLEIVATDASQAEGNAGNTSFTFTVTRTGVTSGATSVDYLVGGSGADPADAADFGGAFPGGTVVFAATETSRVIAIDVSGDLLAEMDEGFTVNLSNQTAPVSLITASADGLIVNDDTSLAISATDAVKDEGAAGTTPFTFTVTRTGDLAIVSDVEWAVTGSTANPANAADFGGTLPSGVVNFLAGEATQTITVDVTGDTIIEGNEGFTVTLSNPSAPTTITAATAGGLINNDDSQLSLVATDLVKSESDAGAIFQLNVVRTGDLRNAVNFDITFSASGLNPASGADFAGFVSLPFTLPNLSIPANSASTPIFFTVAGDTIVEPDEGFTITLSNPDAPVTIGVASVDGVIINDDTSLSIAATDAVKDEGDAGNTQFTFTVSRDGDTSVATDVDYVISGGATDPADAADFGGTLPSGMVSFAIGESSKEITVDVSGDTINEADESFVVTLSNATGTATIGTATADGTINDDDPIDLSITSIDSVQSEGDVGNTTFNILVTRTGDLSGSTTVELDIAGSGTNPADVADFGGTFPSSMVVFGVGVSSMSVPFTWTGDTDVEADETWTATLDNATGFATIVGLPVEGTIENDDIALNIAATDAVKNEGDAGTTAFTFTVTRTGDLDGATSVDYAITGSGASAADATDFGGTLPSGTVNFAAGESTMDITVDVSGDTVIEANDEFTVTLSNASGVAIIGSAAATGSITNDDITELAIAATDAIKDEEDTGTTSYTFTVTRSGDLSSGTTVDYVVAGDISANQADAGDFGGTFPTGTVTFAATEATQLITIDVSADTDVEANDGFIVTLQNSSAPSTILTAVASGLIVNDDVTLSISATDVVKDEGDTGNTAFTFTVTRTGDARFASTVDYAVTGSGTNAADAVDFGGTLPSGMVSFAVGEVTQVVTVNVSGDTVIEADEEFTVTLSNPSIPALLTAATAGGIIVNDDNSTVAITATDAIKTEGTGGTTPFTFTVTRSGDLSIATTVDYSVFGSTANPANAADFGGLLPSGTVIFAATEAIQIITIDVGADTLIEANEGFIVQLGNPSVPTIITTATADGLINNDDVTQLAIVATDADKDEGNFGTNAFTFTVTRTGDLNATTTVDYAVTGSGAAQANTIDFGGALPTGTVTFATGETTQIVSINVAGDTIIEADEGFTVTISNASAPAVITTATADGVIQNEDSTFSITVDDADKAEGDAATTPFTFTIRRTGDLTVAADVDYAVMGAGATPADATDFGGALPVGTVSFAANEANKTLTIDVTGDTVVEDDNGFTVALTNPTAGATITTPTAGGVINNDDSIEIAINAGPVSVDEGNAGNTTFSFTVTRTGDLSVATDVDYTVAGTGANPADAADFGGALPAGTVTFAATESSRTISILVSGDTTIEPDEAFEVVLSNPTAPATITADTGAGIIVADDIALSIVATDAVKDEGDTGTTPFTFTITRGGDLRNATTVDYVVTGSGTDPADAADFGGAFPSGSVMFAAGETTQILTIDVSGDVVIEPDNGFTVTLSNPTVPATLLTATADGLIVEDELPVVTLSATPLLITETGGNSVVTATLSRVATTTVIVDLAFTGTAVGRGTDYNVSGTQITITPGNLSGTIAIDSLTDPTQEVDETVIVDIDSATGAREAGVEQIIVTIRDDSPPPTVTLSVDKPAPSETDGEIITVTANLSVASTLPVTVDLAVGGTATGGGTDYNDPAGLQIVIIPGQTSGSITYSLVGDTTDEVDETVDFTITGITNGQHDGLQLGRSTIIDDDLPPEIFVTVNPTVNEGATATFNVAIAEASTFPVTIDLGLGGAATGGGQDYTDPASLQVMIPAGMTSTTFDVVTLIDGIHESPESLVVAAVGATNASVTANSQAATSIISFDPEPTVNLSAANATVTENFGRVDFVATLSIASGSDVTVNLAPLFTAGDAVVLDDYSLSDTQIVIPAGSTTGSITLLARRDGLDEFDENVTLEITSANNGIVGTSNASTTIVDADIEPTVALSTSTTSVAEDGGTVTFFATLNAVSGKNVTVNLQLSGEAINGTDYTAGPLSFVIPAGSLSGQVDITIIDDAIDEFSELVVISFVSVDNAVENIVQQSTTLIRDNDATPTLTTALDVATLVESGLLTSTFTVRLSEPSGKDVTVDVTVPGTATGGGVDYTGGTTQLMIPAGSITASTSFTVVDDNLHEFDETIAVTATNIINATPAGPQSQTITITDDDAPPVVSLSIDNPTIAENGGAAVITATLSEISGREYVVFLGRSGSATAGSDYTPLVNSVTIPAGSLTGTVTLAAVSDALDEFDEVVDITMLPGGATDPTLNPAATSVSTVILDDDDLPTVDLSVNTAAIAENGGSAVFTAILSAVSGRDITIDLDYSGQATDPADFGSSNTQIVIPAGMTTGSVTVTAVQDVLDEDDETLTVQIISADVAAPGTTLSQTIMITDDDAQPGVGIALDTTSIPETGGVARLTATLTEISGRDVVLDLQITGTATFNVDYTGLTPQITIPAGSISAEVSILAVDENLDENSESVNLSVTNAQNANFDGIGRTLTIVDDDDPTLTVTLAAPAVNEADTNPATMVTVTRNTDTTNSLQVILQSDDLSEASAPVNITIPAGASFITVPVTVVNDNILDGTQTVTFTARSGGFNTGTGMLNVEDATAAVNLSVSTNTASEAGQTVVTVTVTAEKPVIGDQTLNLSVNGPGLTANDYTLVDTQLTILNGQTEASTTFTVADDALVEALNEIATIGMTNLSTGLGLGTTASQDISITDNDSASLTIDNITITEGDSGPAAATFTVTLNSAVDTSFTVDYGTADNTATAVDNDFTATANQLTFVGNAGETQSFSIDVIGDQKVELDESFFVNLSNVMASGRNVTIADGQGVADITNDDAASVSVLDVDAVEGDAGTTAFMITLALDTETDFAVSVDYATADNSASSGVDYDSTNGSETFVANDGGPQTVIVTVNVTGDDLVELDETFFLDLSNLVAGGRNITIADSRALATIQNDDTAQLSIDSVTAVEGDSGETIFTFTTTLDNDVDTGLTVSIGTANGSALQGQDYIANTGTMLNFAGNAGETQTFNVRVLGDTTVEGDENFFVNLSRITAGGRNVVLGTAQGTGNITEDDSAEISISNAIVTEGANGTQDITFDVTLNNAVDTDVTVDYATAAITATAADNDYADTSGTLTFAANSASPQTRTVTVQVNGDTKVELDETFALDLSNLITSGLDVTLANARGIGTITNDDSAAVTISDLIQDETDAGITIFSFNVSLDAEIDVPMTLDFTTSGSSATIADNDYIGGSGTGLTFTANSGGSQIQQINVQVMGDSKVELDEAFFVDIANLATSGRNVTITDNQAVGTIRNDDAATLTIADVSVDEGNTTATTVTFTVTLDNEVDSEISVDYDTNNNSATSGDLDYVSNTGNSFTFAANSSGSQSQTFTVDVTGDNKVELDETFFATLTGLATNGRAVTLAKAQAIATIVNDDSATISIKNATRDEGNSGITVFTFDVELSNETDVPVVVDYTTIAGTATAADSDYTPSNGESITFAANNGSGIQTVTIPISVLGDEKLEQDETFLLNLLSLQAGGRDITIAENSGTGTIVNDDEATITIDDVSIEEGDSGLRNLVFNVTLNAEVNSEVTVDYALAGGTATANVDYQPIPNGTLTFPGSAGLGAQTQTISIPIIGDAMVELDETLLINLTNATDGGEGVTIGDGIGIGTVTNDDAAVINIDSISVAEGDGTGNTATFTISIDNAVDAPVNLSYSINDGTATLADSDYTSDPISQLIFDGTAGQTLTVSIQTNPDSKVELDETVLVNLLNLNAAGRNVTTGTSQGVATILNDDAATISINDVTVTEGNQGSTLATFTISLNGELDVPLSVRHSTADGSATADSGDFTSGTGVANLSGLLNSSAVVTLPILGDINVEPDENFFVDLSNLIATGRNVTIADGRGEGTITNDDFVNVSIVGSSVSEGFAADGTTLSFTITRDNTTVPVTIDFATADGTATLADNDYIVNSGSFTMAAGGVTTQQIFVTVIGDHITEADESLTLNLTSATPRVVFTNNSAIGTILQDDGSVSGQKWLDSNNNGQQDATEPGLDGWEIQLFDSNGNLITSSLTRSVDLNNDGEIDPLTERGLYTVPVNQGSWNVEEVLRSGWRQSFPNSGNGLAFQIDSSLNLRFSGNFFEDWGGLGEKWLRSDDGWVFITPAGNVFEWDNSPRTNLTGSFLGSLGSQYHATPSLLYNAQPNVTRQVTVVTGQDVSDIHFGNTPTGLIEGRKFHDVDADNFRDANEPWLNGWTITLTDSTGNVIGTAVTSDFDRDGNGSIDPDREVGWYSFGDLLNDTYTVTEESRPGWSQSGSEGLFANEAYQLDQELQFREPNNDFQNWGFRNERWVFGNTGWHFITPDGQLFQWDNSPRSALTGNLISTLDSSYWEDLSLLYNAQQPGSSFIELTGQEVSDFNFGNTFGHNGTGSGNVTAAIVNGNLQITGDSAANTVVVHTTSTGTTVVTGAAGTQVNGTRNPFLVTALGNVSIDLGDGNDQFVIVGSAVDAAASISIEAGAGADRLAITELSTNAPVTISNAGGNDVRRVQAASVGSLVFSGQGSSSVEDSVVNGNLSSSSNGESNVVINGSQVTGATNLSGSSSNDGFITAGSIFDGAFTANGNDRHDLIVLGNSQFNAAVNAEGNSGRDTLGVRGNNVFGQSADFDGGQDDDVFATDGVGPAPTLRRIEANDNSTLDELIDLALSDFDDLVLDL